MCLLRSGFESQVWKKHGFEETTQIITKSLVYLHVLVVTIKFWFQNLFLLLYWRVTYATIKSYILF